MPTKTFGTAFGTVLLAALFFVAPAKAQIYGVFDMGALTNTLSQDALTQSEQARADGDTTPNNSELDQSEAEAADAGTANASEAPDGQRLEAPAIETLSFSPSLQQRRDNLEQFVERRRAIDPVAAEELAVVLTQGDVIEALSPELAAYGLRTDNLADAYAVWWITAWQIWAGDTSDFSVAQADGAKHQAAIAILSTPAITNATDTQKQRWAEEFLVEAMIFSAALEQMKTEPSQPALQAHMTQLAQSMGMDFTTMTLTDNGFALR
ncbi:MAG: DUF6683 family protein [Cyanobacteria bacterium J06597_16]